MFVFLVHMCISRRKIMILRRDVLFYIKKTSLLFCDVGLSVGAKFMKSWCKVYIIYIS